MDDLFKDAIERLYEQKRILPETRKKMMQELYEPLAAAVKEGFSKEIKVEYNTPNYEFLKQLKTNVAVFAAFKNHARMKEVGELLTDANGNKRSKADFVAEALKLNPKYKVQWLNVEYDAAVKQGRSAAQYKKALETEKLFPNIKYMPSVSAEPRQTHMKYYGIVLPIKHPLWDKILPIKEFGCKCWWKVTDEEAQEPHEDFEPLPAHDGLGMHPGKTGQIFDIENTNYSNTVSEDLKPELIKEAEELVDKLEDYETLEKVSIFNENYEGISAEMREAYPSIDWQKINSLNMYTGYYYYEINSFNRGFIDKIEILPEHGITEDFYTKLTRTINKTLDEIPDKFTGTTFRGTELTRAEMQPYFEAFKTGKPHREASFMSSSYEEREAFDGNVNFIIESKNGTMIEKVSEKPFEKEVLYKAGQEFKVTDIKEFDGDVWHVYLEQL